MVKGLASLEEGEKESLRDSLAEFAVEVRKLRERVPGACGVEELRSVVSWDNRAALRIWLERRAWFSLRVSWSLRRSWRIDSGVGAEEERGSVRFCTQCVSKTRCDCTLWRRG